MDLSAWQASLSKKLMAAWGDKKGSALYQKYYQAFAHVYCEESSLELVLQDINFLEKLTPEHFIEIDFYFSQENQEKLLHLRIYKREKLIALSDLLPILSDFDLRAFSERTYRIDVENNVAWISDFVISYVRGGELDLAKMKDLFHGAFAAIFSGQFESDGFNKLILAAFLSWREVTIIRAYAKYLRQTRFRFSQAYIEATLVHHAPIIRNLIELFNVRLNPQQKGTNKNQAQLLEENILRDLEKIQSLDEDLTVRRFLELIKATLRTNFFQADTDNTPKPYLSFKLLSAAIPELPLPLPLYEIFVYSPRFEGIHLRAAKVARGGIRWSDRREDFRREVLGLMKAQWVKNSIIVPSGAKGGFVLKTAAAEANHEALQKEVIACYQLFIAGLLDLTDNIVEGKRVHPPSVRCLDDFDPYLVVAADKGTADFSDIANNIAKQYHFWLGDAFASGGKTGYDHKKIGITARGAWESVKRHFRELNRHFEDQPITLVGIGDMSGDVFGNGLTYCKQLKLVAAFDHRHIFLDPDPDPELSYQERLRLFNLPGSSWADYNPKLISAGGGVYKRSAKSIALSAEARRVLAIQKEQLLPSEVIRAILRAPVDLLWNGGIGTYVKGSSESHADVGDKSNDANRVNGGELRCKIVGEGGNLGFTQRGRVEYALHGGLINTDFIDNSAGVDCSDHEVNLKILLNHEMAKGSLSEEKRNTLLMQMTGEIAQLVLQDNYEQAWAISFLTKYAYGDTGLYQGYIKELETVGLLNREVEFLPDDKTILERRAQGKGLTSPELAVLLSYSKIYIKNEILKSDLPEDPFFAQMMADAFPQTINKMYHEAGTEHILRREIIATQISSRLVNEMGIVFIYRLQSETGANIADVIRAYAVASTIFESQKTRQLIDSLNSRITVNIQYEWLHHVRHLINISTRWFLYENRLKGDMAAIIEHYYTRVKKLETLMLDLMTGYTQHFLENIINQFSQAGLDNAMAKHIAAYRVAYISLNIIEVATKHHFDLERAARLYFAVGERFNLVWFRDHIANDVREGAWNALARLTLRDELDALQKALTVEMLKTNKKEEKIENMILAWVEKNINALKRWEKLFVSVHESSVIEYTMFFIVLRELGNLIEESI